MARTISANEPRARELLTAALLPAWQTEITLLSQKLDAGASHEEVTAYLVHKRHFTEGGVRIDVPAQTLRTIEENLASLAPEPEPSPETIDAPARPKGPERDKATGRYTHIWGVIGSDETGETWECSHCGNVQLHLPGGKKRTFTSREKAAEAGAPFLEGYAPGYMPAPERVPDIGTQPCSNCGYSVALHGTPGRPLCADCAVAAKHRLDSDEPKSDSSPKPASSGALKGATTMAITDRNLAPGTKLVGKHKGQTYNAEVVEVDGATRYRMTIGGETKDYKSPSAAGSAIFGVDKAGKPRTCNGWGFFSIDGDAPPAAPKADTAPTGRTRRRKKGETDNQTTEEPKPAALPIIERLDDQVECGECGLIFAERGDAVAHLAEDHGIKVESAEPTVEPTTEPTPDPDTEKELATA